MKRLTKHPMSLRPLLYLAILAVIPAAVARSEEIRFVETFALAEDREAALKQLIPGTEEYYYYHCLHYLNTEQYNEVESLLPKWIERHKVTARVREIQHRLHLQTYAASSEKTLAYLRNALNLRFDHQRERLQGEHDLPSVLDPQRISRDELAQRALAKHPDLQGFEPSSFRWLLDTELSADQRRALLQRLTRPDYPNLAKLVVADLRHERSRGFGSLPIHSQLLKSQLDECLKLYPELRNQSAFINVYLLRLQPNADVDIDQNDAAHRAYLDRLWAFVQTLSPAHNSLKAHVLYQILRFDRAQGRYDRDLFMTYIKLPRNTPYMSPEYLRQGANRGALVDLNAGYDQVTRYGPIRDDVELIESYLQHFFLEDETYDEFLPYLRDTFLKRVFAETKILNGLGDPERWYSMLSPAAYQALKERVDLDFAYDNQEHFEPRAPISVDLYVKNVETLIVKVYRINTLSYYLSELAPVTTDIQLDGLVANEELTFEYDEPPLRRVRRHFEFPDLTDRGVYVIDFIGNGKSSRALVRKGRLHHLAQTSTAGQVLTILNESDDPVPGAAVHLGGKRYVADEQGEVLLPFTSSPSSTPIVISHDNFATLARLDHEGENYALRAGIYVDRESLLQHRKASAIIRPALYLNGTPVSLEILEDVALAVTSVDHDGISATRPVPDFELHENKESVFEFQVPPRLATLTITLTARVAAVSRTSSEKVALAASQQFTVNQITASDKIEDLHLLQADGQYTLELLGKTGEARPQRPVTLTFRHTDFVEPVTLTLQTDAQGRISLGALPEIAHFTARSPSGVEQQFPLRKDRHNYSQTLSGQAGEVIEVPYMGSSDKPQRDEVSLLSYRANHYYADHFDQLSIEAGLLQLKDLEPGDYTLLLKDQSVEMLVRVTEGPRKRNYYIGDSRALEIREASPLQIGRVDVDDQHVTIRVVNANAFTRVHVFASRYVPDFDLFDLAALRDAEPYLVHLDRPTSRYLAGRNIGDEYRYIIDRKYATKYPGNMLERPELLLNPWAIRSTQTGAQAPQAGEDFARVDEPKSEDANRDAYGGRAADHPQSFSTLDFLSEKASVFLNLRPDDKGVIQIDREALGPHLHLHIVAIDPLNTAFRNLSLPYKPMQFLDLRLADSLDAETHFTQQKQISIIKQDEKFVLSDISSARFEAYDTVESVFNLYRTLTNDSKLQEFQFLVNWPSLDPDEKRSKYSKYASHELNFFLYNKDPAFFEEVIEPYLHHKKDKTFLDRWLLEMDLSEYLEPWSYARLNTVERILLARRVAEERASTRQYVLGRYQLLPPQRERWIQLYNTAIASNALTTADARGVAGKLSEMRRELGRQDKAAMPALADAMDRPAAAPKPRSASRARVPQEKDAKGLQSLEKKAMEQEQLNGRRAGRFFMDNRRKSAAVELLYQTLEKTKEWVENNYYHLPIEDQLASLVDVNQFWRDFVEHDPDGPFFSPYFPEASGNFTEMMFALSVLNLPWEGAEHEVTYDDATMTMVAAGPVILFHEEIKPAEKIVEDTPILVSQNFFRRDDRYRMVENERVDKFVTEEFLIQTIYGCQIVVTNPTSATQKLDLLLQIPEGALPVQNGQYLRSIPLRLEAFNTQTFEYFFYFPLPGDFTHYPVQISRNEELVAAADPFTFHVVKELSKVDTESWNYLSQFGNENQVLEYLRTRNLFDIDLSRIAFRMSDKDFFLKATGVLDERHVYNHLLWSYSIHHNATARIAQYLRHADDFIAQTGPYLQSPLLTIEPVERHLYQHREYHPLVNARTHQLGEDREILNDRFFEQYHSLMEILKYHRDLSDEHQLAVTYYLLLQDRVEEALTYFAQVDRDRVTTRMQYDYCAAYLNFYLEKPERSQQIAEPYADHQVDRWRNVFQAVLTQVREIKGKASEVVDPFDRSQAQGELARTAPSFDWKVEDGKIEFTYQNLETIDVHYYLMDIELLFSSNPFVQEYTGQFAYIHPNEMQSVKLPADQNRVVVDLPKSLNNRNVLIEAHAAGQVKSQAYYSNSLSVQLVESYGQIRVSRAGKSEGLPKVYVKVYARMNNGDVRFYKDGYTDLRGRFDYTSLSTNDLDNVSRFSLLILSDSWGAVIKEAAPPKR